MWSRCFFRVLSIALFLILIGPGDAQAGGRPASAAEVLGASSGEAPARGGGMESELYGVRFKGEAEALNQIERAAAQAGWDKALHEGPTSLVLMAPSDYSIAHFKKLIGALGHIKNKNFGLQLLGPGGRAVDADGHFIDEK
jgi:hypothetical protein